MALPHHPRGAGFTAKRLWISAKMALPQNSLRRWHSQKPKMALPGGAKMAHKVLLILLTLNQRRRRRTLTMRGLYSLVCRRHLVFLRIPQNRRTTREHARENF